MPEDLDDNINTNATGPRRAAGDSGSVEQHSLPDQIAADKYLLSKAASRMKKFALKLFKISPGGTA